MGLAVSWDDRRFLERLRRSQLYDVCNHFSVPYPVQATADSMRKLLEANNVSDAHIQGYFESKGRLQVVRGKDESGMEHTEVYPVVEPHQSARLLSSGQEINYEQAIADNAAKVAEKDEVIEEQSGMMEQFAEMISELKTEIQDLKQNTLPMEKMTPPQLKGLAKRRGVDVKGLKTSKELLERLHENPS